MPSGDGTGPNGQGPMTGRGMGFCNGYDSPGFTKGIPRGGAGFGRGFRRGLGARRMAFARQQVVAQPVQPVQPQTVVITGAEEKKILEADLEDLKAEMKEIEKRLKDLKE